MVHSARILSAASGSLDAEALFVAEAPGRLGADRTAIPLHGDVAGDNFEHLLATAGIDRSRIYVTNAVLCNPRDERGNNATPTRTEIENCSLFLRRQIEIVKPRLVVSLGARALEALNMLEGHNLTLAQHVGTSHSWYSRKLVPLYHPGVRAMIHRPLEKQINDYKYVASLLPVAQAHISPIDIAKTILNSARKPLSYFALHKIFYLCEFNYKKARGGRLTSAFIIRQQNGPYITDLHIRKLAKALPTLRIMTTHGELYLTLGETWPPTLFDVEKRSTPELDPIISAVISKYADKTDAQLKVAAYLTAPMKSILKDERRNGTLLNRPIEI